MITESKLPEDGEQPAALEAGVDMAMHTKTLSLEGARTSK